jgi:hypothetical protein
MKPLLAIATSLAAIVGCANESGPAESELGRVRLTFMTYFGYGIECIDGCGLERPLMEGTIERGGLASTTLGENLPALTATTTDTSVAAIDLTLMTCCQEANGNGDCYEGDDYDGCLGRGGEASYGYLFELRGGHPGSTALELRTQDGALYDRFTVNVRRAASVEFQVEEYMESGSVSGNGFRTVNSLELVGTHASVRAIAFDSNRQRLLASHGLSMVVQDPAIAAFCVYEVLEPYCAPKAPAFFADLWPKSRGTVMLDVFAQQTGTRIPVVSK